MAEENGAERRVTYEGRFVMLEQHVGRLVSDAESEKETRRRASSRIEADFLIISQRIDRLEQKAYWLAGAIAAVVFLSNWMFST